MKQNKKFSAVKINNCVLTYLNTDHILLLITGCLWFLFSQVKCTIQIIHTLKTGCGFGQGGVGGSGAS